MKEYDYYSSFLTEAVNEKSKNIDKMTSLEMVKLINDEDKKIEEELKGQEEGKDYLKFEWIDLDKLHNYPLKPQVIKDMLRNKEFNSHKIQKD